ncbi:hypothetical protein HaLaN_04617 [Haematococcus lacustris]|uniref:Uncharacterized protein n=1 Tax=Haematococcus lacustris TaxID=44745 RepID=A0A699YT07_HAELA|nr:hypothetical protein HaLaN_04617 [Haematococcus lacustris]
MDAADVSQRLRQHGDDVQRLLAGTAVQPYHDTFTRRTMRICQLQLWRWFKGVLARAATPEQVELLEGARQPACGTPPAWSADRHSLGGTAG